MDKYVFTKLLQRTCVRVCVYLFVFCIAAQFDVEYLEKISEAQSGNFSVSCLYLGVQ